MNTARRYAEIAMRYEALDELVPVHVIRSREDHERSIRALNELLDGGGLDEGSPLSALVETLGELIESYERAELAQPMATGIDALRFLMEQHALRQSDLPELGSQGVVSEILSGRRALTTRHIAALRERFGVSADVFV